MTLERFGNTYWSYATMNQSEQINELAAALAKAQSQITGALKDSKNPFFKSSYADLASCWDACRKQLTENGLSVIQTTDIEQTGTAEAVVVVRTTLAHQSGQWIAGILPVKAKDDGPQAQGSGITYARRYALAAIVGLAQIDDDAEAAQARGYDEMSGEERAKKRNDKAAFSKKVAEYSERIKSAVDQGNTSTLSEILNEVREAGNDFRVSVWTSLPTSIQNFISDKLPKAA